MKYIKIKDQVKPYIYLSLVLCVTILFYKAISNIDRIIGIIQISIEFIIKVLKPLIWGMIIAYFLNRPIMYVDKILLKLNFCKRHIRVSRGFAIILIYSLLIGIIFGIIWYALPQVWASINSIVESTPYYIENLKKFLEGNTLGNALVSSLNKRGDSIDVLLNNYMELNLTFQDIITYLLSRVLNLGSVAINLMLALFLSIYLILDKEVIGRQFTSFIKQIISKKAYDKLSRNIKYMDEIFYDFIIGKIYCSVIIAALVFFGLILMKAPHASLISLLIAVLNIIPYFGPITAGVIGFVLTYMVDRVKAIWVLILLLITQEIEDNILSPKIIGDAIGLKPFWIMLAVIIGGEIFGITGMILAIPAFAIFRIFITQWIIRRQS